MNFQIIPAIDIINGKCVRLRQGRVENMTVFSEDPVLVAKRWEQLGADAIHVVDLDGAFKGVPVNFHIIERMASEVAVPIQVGGGIRTFDIASRYFDAGVGKVILGTTIVRDRKSINKITEEYGDSVIAAIDATKGKVAIRGWVEVTGISAIDLARDLESMGIRSFIYTDISRDGMLEGPDYGSIETFATSVKGRMIASGGITAVGDILKIREISLKKAEKRITGVIVGRALYSSRIDFMEARMALKGKEC
jgi:phosphoribosylformimino-5-aminoimidazole carboxamide ribotide isomerase